MSGNVYCMRNSALPGLYKIGISKVTTVRRQFIDRSMRGRVHILFDQRLMWPKVWEKVLHWLFAHIRTTTHGSGKTEWFKPAASPVLPAIWCLVFWQYGEPAFGAMNAIYPGLGPWQILVGGFFVVVLMQVVLFPQLVRILLFAFALVEIALFFLFFVGVIYFLTKMPITLR